MDAAGSNYSDLNRAAVHEQLNTGDVRAAAPMIFIEWVLRVSADVARVETNSR
jgi:hypothetical protein